MPRGAADNSHLVAGASDTHVISACEAFARHSLRKLEPEVDALCHGAIRRRYLDEAQQHALEAALCRIYNFLANLERLLGRPPPPPMPKLRYPPKPEPRRTPPPGLSAEEQRASSAMQGQIAELRRRLKDDHREVVALKEGLRRRVQAAEEKRRCVSAKLALVEPALAKATAGLAGVSEQQLHEVRSYQTPPPTVARVMEAVLTLLGEATGARARTWEAICGFLRRRDFIASVRAFDAARVTEGARLRAKALAFGDGMTVERAHQASRAAAPLLRWVQAMTRYAAVQEEVRPLQSELAELDAEIAAAQAELDRRTRVGGMRELLELTREHDARFGERALRERQDAARQADDAHNTARREEWNRLCAQLKHDAMAKRARPPPSVVLSIRGGETVADVRRRCNMIIAAVAATKTTLDALEGDAQCARAPRPLVVQRGRCTLSDAPLERFREAVRRRASSVHTRSIAAAPTAAAGGRMPGGMRRYLDSVAAQRALSDVYCDPHHPGLVMSREAAADSRVLMMGEAASSTLRDLREDGTVRER